MKNSITISILAAIILCYTLRMDAQKSYQFDKKGISETVLKAYLSRSITMAEFLTSDPYCVDGTLPNKYDDIRMVKNIGAKFIGRAIYRWGKEDVLINPDYLKKAKAIADNVHQFDGDIVLQGALFEMISPKVNNIPVPLWVFNEFDLPVENRNFDYTKMLNLNGKMINQWGKSGSVPDITRIETQMWFMYLAGTYMELGCEAFHLGQIALIGMEDKNFQSWGGFIGKLRKYAQKHARRGWVLLDAHTPSGGMVADGKSLLDFNSFLMRIKEIPEKPMECKLQVAYLDGLYGRSKSCITPGGWKSKSLPYLVEFDNYGCNRKPGIADTTSIYVWGYDEITWFYLQKEEYKNQWLMDATKWVRDHDENCFLEMPGCRLVSLCDGQPTKIYHANRRTKDYPEGQNVEETIKAIWEKQ